MLDLSEDKNYTVAKVVLTPKREDPGFTIERDFADDYWASTTRFRSGDIIFDADDWEWEIEYTRSARFRKVLDIVQDEDTAKKILDAL